MLTHNLGYPRIGTHRELKKACEKYWAGKLTREELFSAALEVKKKNWGTQRSAGIDLIPCNDFSFYDQVLDMILTTGAVPARYSAVVAEIPGNTEIDLFFAMARGYQKDGLDITAMEMTKWFDTNYHYIVPEFTADQTFSLFSNKIINEFLEAKNFLGKSPKPVIVGPVSFLLSGKTKGAEFNAVALLDQLLPVYFSLLNKLSELGAEVVQLDEPYLIMDLTEQEKHAFRRAYSQIKREIPQLKLLIATYFGGLRNNLPLALSLSADMLHLDLVRGSEQLNDVLKEIPDHLSLSLGVVDGRNIWRNDYQQSIDLISTSISEIGEDRVMLAPSCSLLHVPYDLDLEDELDFELKSWMAFARQKLYELQDLSSIINGDKSLLEENKKLIASKDSSERIHQNFVKERVRSISDEDLQRKSEFTVRKKHQGQQIGLPLFPTTTIGSFPQTTDIRKLRALLASGEITHEQYETTIREVIDECIRLQENIGLDVLVHGEFERNDMVEYFGEHLEGFVFTKNGWVQSYGSRCVKPPVIYGDVRRNSDITVKWSRYAQDRTKKIIKGMLTGPVTILQWSFVRNDQARSETAFQIALAIRDEVLALEKAGIRIIQIDEPAIREGLPLRKADWERYLNWAIKAFKVASSAVKDETQIHTHMCYSEFNDIIRHIASMDADVITIETSRSQMELLESFADYQYPNDIGPGVYDIHSPRIPSVDEIEELLNKAAAKLPVENLWVNPDCGLKTRKWEEVEAALVNMVQAAGKVRSAFEQPALT